MKNTLHITNGDSAAGIIKSSEIDGEVLSWQDPMHHGPFPADLNLQQTSVVRSRYLSGEFATGGQVDNAFVARDELLVRAFEFDEVVLWFEHDLLDQLQIVQILDWFATCEQPPAALNLICVDQFAGVDNFRGIGELNCQQMASLIDLQKSVTSEQMAEAQQAWAAFRSNDPRELLAFSDRGNHVLPFLCAALKRHFEEFPWQSDGLTRTERQLLQLIIDGESRPGRLFVSNMDLESVLFIGDWPTYSVLNRLSTATIPLINCQSGDPFQTPQQATSPEAFRSQRLEPTTAAKKVLSLNQHADECINRDYWLGGVRIDNQANRWRWNHQTKSFPIPDTHNS